MHSPLDILPKAIREYVADVHHGNVRAAARACGVKYGPFYSWYKGLKMPRANSLGNTIETLRAAGKLPSWSIDLDEVQEPEMTLAERDGCPTNELLDFDLIPRMMAVAGCGESYETIAGESGNLYAFRKDFLRRQGLSPKDVYVMYVSGDSMKPTIEDGDMILIHKTENVPQEGYIYALTLGDTLMVKRLQKIPDGWILKSDNPMYSPLTVQGQELDKLVIHGRVRWFSRIL